MDQCATTDKGGPETKATERRRLHQHFRSAWITWVLTSLRQRWAVHWSAGQSCRRGAKLKRTCANSSWNFSASYNGSTCVSSKVVGQWEKSEKERRWISPSNLRIDQSGPGDTTSYFQRKFSFSVSSAIIARMIKKGRDSQSYRIQASA